MKRILALRGNPLYKPYRYLPLQRVGWVFAPVWSRNVVGKRVQIDFANFGLESGKVFEGTTEVYEGIYRFNSK